MTVAELISALSEYESDAEVRYAPSTGNYNIVTSVEQDETDDDIISDVILS